MRSSTCYARNMISYIKTNGELIHVVYHELHRGDSPVHVAKTTPDHRPSPSCMGGPRANVDGGYAEQLVAQFRSDGTHRVV